MGHYVYKYVKDDEIIYIGKCDGKLENRLKQHGKFGDNICSDGWDDINTSDIFYTELINSTMSDVVESELIRRYRPKYNRAKMSDWAGLNFPEPHWIKYCPVKTIKNKEKPDIPIPTFYNDCSEELPVRITELGTVYTNGDLIVPRSFKMGKSFDDIMKSFNQHIYKEYKRYLDILDYFSFYGEWLSCNVMRITDVSHGQLEYYFGRNLPHLNDAYNICSTYDKSKQTVLSEFESGSFNSGKEYLNALDNQINKNFESWKKYIKLLNKSHTLSCMEI